MIGLWHKTRLVGLSVGHPLLWSRFSGRKCRQCSTVHTIEDLSIPIHASFHNTHLDGDNYTICLKGGLFIMACKCLLYFPISFSNPSFTPRLLAVCLVELPSTHHHTSKYPTRIPLGTFPFGYLDLFEVAR